MAVQKAAKTGVTTADLMAGSTVVPKVGQKAQTKDVKKVVTKVVLKADSLDHSTAG